jgi:hypothetical protein
MLVPGKSLVPQTQHREFSKGKQDMPIPYPPHCGALAIPQSLRTMPGARLVEWPVKRDIKVEVRPGGDPVVSENSISLV